MKEYLKGFISRVLMMKYVFNPDYSETKRQTHVILSRIFFKVSVENFLSRLI